MAKKPDWDYALRIKGVTLRTLPVSYLADYLKELVGLMGDDSRPVLDGIVRGSVVVRVKQTGDHPAHTRARLRAAANDPSGPAGKSYSRIVGYMARDGAHGEIVDHQDAVVVRFAVDRQVTPAEPELTVNDVGTLDGRVVGVVGADDTVHVRLRDHGGIEHKVVLRDLAMARELASRFRAGPVRVHVHGTWRRTVEGKWEAQQVYADRVEELDDLSAKEVFDELRAIPTGWAAVADPLKEWASIRGLNDLHH